MFKIIRNTFFAVVCLALAGFGIEWNQVTLERQLAAKPQTDISIIETEIAGTRSSFSLEVETYHQSIELGQTQRVVVKTEPEVDIRLRIVPEKETDAQFLEKKVRSDRSGKAVFEIKIDDYRFVGRAIGAIVATKQQRVATKSITFTIEAWTSGLFNLRGEPEVEYYHPLLP